MEIAKRLNAIIAQLLPFLSQEVNMTTDLFWILCKQAPLDSVTCKLFIWRWFIGIHILLISAPAASCHRGGEGQASHNDGIKCNCWGKFGCYYSLSISKFNLLSIINEFQLLMKHQNVD